MLDILNLQNAILNGDAEASITATHHLVDANTPPNLH